MKFVYYDSKEIEIVESEFRMSKGKDLVEDKQFVFYFKDISELVDLINTSPKLKKELLFELQV